MIDIIILSNSSKKDVLKTLNSILYQIFDGKIMIYILDYNKKIDYSDIVLDYSKVTSIKELKYDDMNIGLAKQYALDNSKGDYIMFINSGDVLSFPFALDFMHSNIKEYDIVYTPYFEKYDEYYKYIKSDEITINSKMFSKKFIVDNNIGFSNININISYSFNYLMKLKKAKMFCLDREILITKSRNIIKLDNEVYQLDYYDQYLNDVLFVIDNTKKNSEIITEALYYSYLYYLANKKIKRKDDLKRILDKYNFKDDTIVKKNCISNDYLMNLLVNSSITFNEYLNRIKE